MGDPVSGELHMGVVFCESRAHSDFGCNTFLASAVQPCAADSGLFVSDSWHLCGQWDRHEGDCWEFAMLIPYVLWISRTIQSSAVVADCRKTSPTVAWQLGFGAGQRFWKFRSWGFEKRRESDDFWREQTRSGLKGSYKKKELKLDPRQLWGGQFWGCLKDSSFLVKSGFQGIL